MKNDQLHNLAVSIENLKDASPFNKAACAEKCLSQAMRVLTDFDNRLQTMERKQ